MIPSIRHWNWYHHVDHKAFQCDVHVCVRACMWLVCYNDVIMGAMASQIISFTIIYSSVYSGADQRKHQSSASLAFVKGIHRSPVNSLHKGPVKRGRCFHLMTSSWKSSLLWYKRKYIPFPYKLYVFRLEHVPSHWLHLWPLLLTWFNFNPSMDK